MIHRALKLERLDEDPRAFFETQRTIVNPGNLEELSLSRNRRHSLLQMR
jgi:hypothetical protein